MGRNASKSASEAKCLREWLDAVSVRYGERPAVSSIDGSVITYAQLCNRVNQLSLQLNHLGIGAEHAVAVALPDGPEAFVALLAVAQTATLFPLNHYDPESEITALFDEIRPAAVIVADDVVGATAAANAKGIPRIAHAASGGSLIDFTWTASVARITATDPGAPHLETPLIYVATAGSTSRPKIVSLTHRSIHTSINHAAEWMEVRYEDRALCVMPFCHLHSVVRSTFPALSRGAEIVCTPGIDPVRMPEWIDRLRPTYVTASPSVYRGLLKRSDITGWQPARSDLRLMVTGSDAIDPRTVTRIQQLLRAPLKQFYGLSEVSPLIAVTPESMSEAPESAVGKLNPMWSLECLDENDQPVEVGQTGQIAVRGGIINPIINSDDTAKRMRSGWFLTGDTGFVDASGYLYFTGRVDDRINLAGKKISVGSIESVLREIRGVADAVVFAVPDTEYGQRVGAAIVSDGEHLEADDIRAAASHKLSHDRVPEFVVITDRLPLSAAGKIQRNKLAEYFKLGSERNDAATDVDVTYVAPRNPTEDRLAGIWREVLELDNVGIHDNFFGLGGNSLLAMQVVARANDVFDVQSSVGSFFKSVTIAELADKIDTSRRPGADGSVPSIHQNVDAMGRGATSIPDEAVSPLSLHQWRLWFIEQFQPGMPLYNVTRAIRMRGPLDRGALESALHALVDRHEALRTTYEKLGGEPVQRINPTPELPERKRQQVPHRDFPARAHGTPIERDRSIVTEFFGERPPLDEPRLPAALAPLPLPRP